MNKNKNNVISIFHDLKDSLQISICFFFPEFHRIENLDQTLLQLPLILRKIALKQSMVDKYLKGIN